MTEFKPACSGDPVHGTLHTPIEEMDFFKCYVEIADWAWETVAKWPKIAQDTLGTQLIRAADSVGANIVEGDGRFKDADGMHF